MKLSLPTVKCSGASIISIIIDPNVTSSIHGLIGPTNFALFLLCFVLILLTNLSKYYIKVPKITTIFTSKNI